MQNKTISGNKDKCKHLRIFRGRGFETKDVGYIRTKEVLNGL